MSADEVDTSTSDEGNVSTPSSGQLRQRTCAAVAPPERLGAEQEREGGAGGFGSVSRPSLAVMPPSTQAGLRPVFYPRPVPYDSWPIVHRHVLQNQPPPPSYDPSTAGQMEPLEAGGDELEPQIIGPPNSSIPEGPTAELTAFPSASLEGSRSPFAAPMRPVRIPVRSLQLRREGSNSAAPCTVSGPLFLRKLPLRAHPVGGPLPPYQGVLRPSNELRSHPVMLDPKEAFDDESPPPSAEPVGPQQQPDSPQVQPSIRLPEPVEPGPQARPVAGAAELSGGSGDAEEGGPGEDVSPSSRSDAKATGSGLCIEVTVAIRSPFAAAAAGAGGSGGGKAGAKAGGRQAEDESRSGYVRGPVCGLFDLKRYLEGRDCVLYSNRYLSRSHFEKVGGSKMAKWYRSIRVLPDLEPIGEWLERHGLAVTKGPARRSSKRPVDSGDEQGQGFALPVAHSPPDVEGSSGGEPSALATVAGASAIGAALLPQAGQEHMFRLDHTPLQPSQQRYSPAQQQYSSLLEQHHSPPQQQRSPPSPPPQPQPQPQGTTLSGDSGPLQRLLRIAPLLTSLRPLATMPREDSDDPPPSDNPAAYADGSADPAGGGGSSEHTPFQPGGRVRGRGGDAGGSNHLPMRLDAEGLHKLAALQLLLQQAIQGRAQGQPEGEGAAVPASPAEQLLLQWAERQPNTSPALIPQLHRRRIEPHDELHIGVHQRGQEQRLQPPAAPTRNPQHHRPLPQHPVSPEVGSENASGGDEARRREAQGPRLPAPAELVMLPMPRRPHLYEIADPLQGKPYTIRSMSHLPLYRAGPRIRTRTGGAPGELASQTRLAAEEDEAQSGGEQEQGAFDDDGPQRRINSPAQSTSQAEETYWQRQQSDQQDAQQQAQQQPRRRRRLQAERWQLEQDESPHDDSAHEVQSPSSLLQEGGESNNAVQWQRIVRRRVIQHPESTAEALEE
uniref:RlsC n=1 Tax=Platydorina caudata TaxID=51709 RepID=A0A1W5IWS5_9CHLO|nr:rlsC [Platydorina caudata]